MLTFCSYGGTRVAILRPGPCAEALLRPGLSTPPPRPARAAPAPPLPRSNPAHVPASLAWAKARRGRVRRGDKALPRVRSPSISASAIMGQMIHFNLAISLEGMGTGCV